MLGPPYGSKRRPRVDPNDSGWNPPVGRGRWTTGAITDGGYGTINPFPFCGGRAIGSGCPRTSLELGLGIKVGMGARYDFVHGSVNSSYATTGLSGRILGRSITGSVDALATATLRCLAFAAGLANCHIIQQGA